MSRIGAFLFPEKLGIWSYETFGSGAQPIHLLLEPQVLHGSYEVSVPNSEQMPSWVSAIEGLQYRSLLLTGFAQLGTSKLETNRKFDHRTSWAVGHVKRKDTDC